MRKNIKKLLTMFLSAAIVSSLPLSRYVVHAAEEYQTYTTNSEFDLGSLIGVEHDTVSNQIQLSKNNTTLPFIWVPNQNGTVSKINTETGKELGRYYTAPSNMSVSPSRTTVDQNGSCWVGIRSAGTVVKIGLAEVGQWVDRNGDGICQTSTDKNNDGNISTDEMLPWGQDEAVLLEVVLIPGKLGAYLPGTYTGGYDTDYWGVAPRGIGVNASGDIWIGTWSTRYFYLVDGETGKVKKSVDFSSMGVGSYGAVVDKNGVLWSSTLDSCVIRFNPVTEEIKKIALPLTSYGIGLDYNDHLFVIGWGQGTFSRININTGEVEWTKPCYGSNSKGVVVSSDNRVWVAAHYQNAVAVFDNDGNLLKTIDVGSQPTGVSIDAAGKVWSCNLGDNYVKRIDPSTYTVDLSKDVVGSNGHYTYSDMTGIISRTITTKTGSWTVVRDSEQPDNDWGKVSWNSREPEGTSVTVKVRSSNDNATWSSWETAENGKLLSSTPKGRYLQIQTTLKIASGDKSPVLYDLTVENLYRSPILNSIGSKSIDEGKLLQFTATAADPNNDTLKYTAENLPEGAVLDPSTGVFTWTPNFSQAGVYPGVKFIVSDGNLIDEELVTITVNNINRAPELDIIGNKAVDENQSIQFTLTAKDPDGDKLQFTTKNLPEGATFDSATSTFTWKPSFSQAGIYKNVMFTVSDGSLTDEENVTITVNNVNRAPILDAIGNKTVGENQSVQFIVTAKDADNDNLLFSAENLPVGAAFDAATSTFTWKPTNLQSGSYANIKFKVSDGSLGDEEVIAITVLDILPQTGSPLDLNVLIILGLLTIGAGSALIFRRKANK